MVKVSIATLLVELGTGNVALRMVVVVRSDVSLTLTLSSPHDSSSRVWRFCPLNEIVATEFETKNLTSILR